MLVFIPSVGLDLKGGSKNCLYVNHRKHKSHGLSPKWEENSSPLEEDQPDYSTPYTSNV